MPVDIGAITNPKLVLDKLKEVEVVQIITKLSADFNIVFRVFVIFLFNF